MNRMPSGGLPQIQIPAEKKKARRGYQAMPAIDPNDGKFWEVLVSDEKINFTAARGMGAAKVLAYCVPKVLISPKCVFRGVREHAEDNWLCYVGCPSHDYSANGNCLPIREKYLFEVYVTDERVIYNWRWEQCDDQDVHLPKNHVNRFTLKVL